MLLLSTKTWSFLGFQIKKKFLGNLGQKTCRLFHFLAQFVYTTNETEQDYYQQKGICELAHELRILVEDLRKLWIFKIVPEMLRFDGKLLTKSQIWRFLVKNWKKSAVKHFIEKPILLNFTNLLPNFCPRLSEEKNLHF